MTVRRGTRKDAPWWVYAGMFLIVVGILVWAAVQR